MATTTPTHTTQFIPNSAAPTRPSLTSLPKQPQARLAPIPAEDSSKAPFHSTSPPPIADFCALLNFFLTWLTPSLQTSPPPVPRPPNGNAQSSDPVPPISGYWLSKASFWPSGSPAHVASAWHRVAQWHCMQFNIRPRSSSYLPSASGQLSMAHAWRGSNIERCLHLTIVPYFADWEQTRLCCSPFQFKAKGQRFRDYILQTFSESCYCSSTCVSKPWHPFWLPLLHRPTILVDRIQASLPHQQPAPTC